MNTAERAAFVTELSNYIFERKDLTIGQIIYSIYRPQGKTEATNLSYLLSLSDSESLNRIEKAIEIEKE